jgi:hypothetical protein
VILKPSLSALFHGIIPPLILFSCPRIQSDFDEPWKNSANGSRLSLNSFQSTAGSYVIRFATNVTGIFLS